MTVSVLIPAGGSCPHRAAALDWVAGWWAAMFPMFEVVVESDDTVPYNKAAVANRARGRASGDVLILADGDVFLDPQLVVDAVRLARGGEWGWPWNRCPRLDQPSTARILTQAPGEPTRGVAERVTGPAAGGLVVVPARLWDRVRGMDERFEGWGGEDNALALTLAKVHGEGFRLDGALQHLWHPRTPGGLSDTNRGLYERYRAATRHTIRTLISEKP